MIALDNFLGESSEVTLLIDHFPKIRLSEDGQGISSYLTTFARRRTLDKVRYRSKLALGNDLESFSCLEGETVLWNVYLSNLARAGMDV